MLDIQLSCIPAFSAIYYALLQSSYEFSQIERDEETCLALRRFADSNQSFPYFSQVWQPGCKVYPYWPRAALLETASLFIGTNGKFHQIESLRKLICSFTNISDSDRDEGFWQWLMDFPAALSNVQNSNGFQAYFHWEQGWLQAQSLHHMADLATIQNAFTAIQNVCGSILIPKIEIVINPVKCVYSADYHRIDRRFIFSSGRLSASSVIHESLHSIIHPYILQYSEQIICRRPHDKSIDASYYLDGKPEGYLNAFEEIVVRKMTSDLMTGRSKKIEAYISDLLS